MSRIIWSPELGWHDGPEARLELDAAGRIKATPEDTAEYLAGIADLDAHAVGPWHP